MAKVQEFFLFYRRVISTLKYDKNDNFRRLETFFPHFFLRTSPLHTHTFGVVMLNELLQKLIISKPIVAKIKEKIHRERNSINLSHSVKPNLMNMFNFLVANKSKH